MTVNDPLILYTRVDCHLCDLAVRMLDKVQLSWRSVDIDGDPDLASKYGVYVPVVQHPASGRELFFPFDEDALRQFAAADRRNS